VHRLACQRMKTFTARIIEGVCDDGVTTA